MLFGTTDTFNRAEIRAILFAVARATGDKCMHLAFGSKFNYVGGDKFSLPSRLKTTASVHNAELF